jgi:teichuronic acid exporter
MISTAVKWAGADAVSAFAINFVTLTLLSRILPAADFGLVALAQAVVGLVQLVCGAGISEAIIQRQHLTESHKGTAFTAATFFGFAGGLACCLVALIIYVETGESRIPLALALESLTCLLFGIEVLPTALLLREFKTATLAQRTILSRIVYLIAACSFAVSGFGFWSVIFADVLQYLAGTILLLSIQGQRLRLFISWPHLKELIAFGSSVVVENVLWAVLSRVFTILVGKMHGLEFLGFISIAMKATDAIASVIQTVTNRVALPMLSRAQNDLDLLAAQYGRASEIIVQTAWPIFTVMALTAGDWVPLVIGKQWIAAVPVIQVMCVTWILTFSRSLVGSTLRAIGKPRAYLLAAVCAATATPLALLFTAEAPPVSVAIAWSLRIAVTIPIGVFLLTRVAKIGPKKQLAPLLKPAACMFSMAFAVLICRVLLQDSVVQHGPLFLMTSCIVIGIATYALASSVLYRETVGSLLRRKNSLKT